jgi:hypothetical protein
MVKVLIYSSKSIHDDAPFEGRAEADIIGYREGDWYHIIKNRTSTAWLGSKLLYYQLERAIEVAERDIWLQDKEAHDLAERYETHPVI